MLSDRDRELLTASVDGELTARQRRHVVRLLRRSREARHLFRQFQTDALALRALGRAIPPRLEVDLSGPVLRTIAAQPRPTACPVQGRKPRQAPFPAWSGFAAAAAVLLMVGVGSFLFFAHEDIESADHPAVAVRPQGNRAQGNGASPPSQEKREKPPVVVKNKKPAPPLPPERPAPDDDEGMAPGPGDPVVRVLPRPVEGEGPGVPPPAPKERPKEGAILTSHGTDLRGKFTQVDLVLPSVFAVHGLDDAGTRQRLLTDLRRGAAFRAELLCRDTVRAFERLRPAFQASRIGLVVEPLAQARLRPPPAGLIWRTDFAIFLENVTPEELADLLRHAGVEDRKAAIRRAGDRRFEGGLIVAPLALDHKDLTGLFGSKSVRVRPSQDGRGPTTRSALVVPYAPVRPRAGSPEIKRFLDARQPPRPGTLQVFLVLRGV